MLEEYLHYIQEGYILSDKTISVNLDDFESGKKNKLIIIGLCGSGKTSLGEYLVKKYKVKNFISDKPWPITKAGLLSPKRTILESAGFIWMVHEPKWKKIVISNPMILIGMSAIKAGIRADRRDGTIPGVAKDKKDIYYFVRSNFIDFQRRFNKLRKEIINIPGAKIKEYTIPKFITVLH
jgi:GTPase SAR1 family protein